MRFISTHIHGILDYVVGALLIGSPWMFGFALGGVETWVPVLLGASAILYSLITDYELGVVKTIPIRTHLVLDMLVGAFLAISPWVFGFSDLVWPPHLVLGFFELATALATETTPARRGARAARL